jgi:hypothetical protein
MNSVKLAHGEMVRDLGRAVVEGPRGLRGVQNLIVAVVREEAWRDFVVPGTGEHFTYGPDEFARFITAHPFAGLGADLATVRALCEGDVEAERAIDGATQPLNKNGTNQHAGDRNPIPSTGRGRDYDIARLKRDAPELAEMVINGELSANAAAIEAGFRKRATPLDQLRKAWSKAGADERAAFLAEI